MKLMTILAVVEAKSLHSCQTFLWQQGETFEVAQCCFGGKKCIRKKLIVASMILLFYIFRSAINLKKGASR